MEIAELVKAQRTYFETDATKDVAFRVAALTRLRQEILRREKQLLHALQEDLGKAPAEGYMTEVGMVLDELGYLIKHTPRWAKRRRVRTPFAQFPARSFVLKEPYGVALIMAPWNYPFQLTLEPLCGALAAGNCAVVKPSAYAPATSAAIADLLSACFPQEYVAVVQGGREQNSRLLEQKFDYIFFTGGITVGKLVMQSAARNLTPVSLELGGKSPCIVDATADLRLAAKRIAFGKLLNAGQTCVAPDYVLAQHSIKAELVRLLREEMAAMLGEHPERNPEYPAIINEKHFQRLQGLIRSAGVEPSTAPDRRIAPVVLPDVCEQDPVMGEELFGPILPVLGFDRVADAVRFVKSRPRPLALYLFTKDAGVQRAVLHSVSFGGGCVNDTIIHLATHHMGFGGVGDSGMGSYHGRRSFDTFTHEKSIVSKALWLDLPFRYHPYTEKKERMVRRFLK